MGHPYTRLAIDRDVGGSEPFRRMMETGSGRFLGPSAIDGVIRLYTFGRIGKLPLLLSVNFAVEDVYARWRRKAFVIFPVLLSMCAAIAALSLLFQREMKARRVS